jgi:hypothetical protein
MLTPFGTAKRAAITKAFANVLIMAAIKGLF